MMQQASAVRPRLATLLTIPLTLMAAAGPALGVDKVWTPTTGDSFTEDANWNPAGAPGGSDNALFLDPAVTAVIDFEGSRNLDAFQLGTTGATGGSVRFSGGELIASVSDESYIGNQNSLNSTFLMEGDAVLLYDDPVGAAGGGLGGNGGGQDLEIGAQTGAAGSLGLLHLRGDSVLRIGDDLKIGAEDFGNGEVIVEGAAQVSVGSGLSVSERNGSAGKLTIGGNGLVVTGNSAGAGSSDGYTDEGYLTLSVRADATADVLIKESGRLYSRNLQHRDGASSITVQDNGEFHVFDTFQFAEPNLGIATIGGDPAANFARAANTAENAGAVFNLTLRDNAKFSVDSALDDGTGQVFQGLALSGGNNLAQITGTGGETNINISGAASFVVQQNLYMTLASSDIPVGAESTLRVTGPDATVQINGDLLMSYDPTLALGNADPSTLAAVITADQHTTIEVGGNANIEFGNLAVELDGYTPFGGESYTLLTAGSVSGSGFRAEDFSLAPLASGLSWDLVVGANSVVLNVAGSLSESIGDYNGDGVVDAADYTVWRDALNTSVTPGTGADGSGDGVVDAQDYNLWAHAYGTVIGGSPAAAAAPEPAAVGLLALMTCAAARLRVRSRA